MRFRAATFVILLLSAGSGSGAADDPVRHGPASPLDESQQAWVDETLAGMSVREMAGQLAMLWTPGDYLALDSEDFEQALERVRSGVGGLWVMTGLPFERAVKVNALQEAAPVPLLVMSSGTFGNRLFSTPQNARLFGGGTDMPPAVAYGAADDPDLVREAARVLARESRAVGINFADDDGGPNLLFTFDNVTIHRSYGDRPERVARLTAAFVHGIHDEGLLAYIGFFPGAGGLDKDPHIELPVLHYDRQRFESHDFVPFRSGIEAGVDIVMTSHFAVPALTGSETLPATFSPEIVRILREDLGFRGLLITDDLSMGGISNRHGNVDAAVRAFEAGHDLLLGIRPVEVPDAIAAKVEAGEISRERLDVSVRRILAAKARLGLHRHRHAPIERVNRVVGRRAHRVHAEGVARRAIVLVRDEGARVPVTDPDALRVLSVTYERAEVREAGRAFDGALRAAVGALDSARVSPETGPEALAALRSRADEADLVIVSVYLPRRLYEREHARISPAMHRFVNELQEADRPPVLVSFAMLPMIDEFPDARTLMLAWSGQPVMQDAAAAALLGIAPITGTLPIRLSAEHPSGSGLRRPLAADAPTAAAPPE
ncbi:MAG: glycoside hydrolase family 3 N-terminal domain-containing protein [Wenzhouxiangellaceae bacterium]|nr:glycoside hydrolase family 3 N-terminal domain-containing protein [Wenzhouxiangellaceae bacterium]